MNYQYIKIETIKHLEQLNTHFIPTIKSTAKQKQKFQEEILRLNNMQQKQNIQSSNHLNELLKIKLKHKVYSQESPSLPQVPNIRLFQPKKFEKQQQYVPSGQLPLTIKRSFNVGKKIDKKENEIQ